MTATDEALPPANAPLVEEFWLKPSHVDGQPDFGPFHGPYAAYESARAYGEMQLRNARWTGFSIDKTFRLRWPGGPE
jgi:hypothetical protein